MGVAAWSGLWFALAIPAIIIMYLFKRKYEDMPVPSHMLWNRVLRNIEANRPWQRLQNRLLLWLQLLAAGLLVFALMLPYVWVKGGASGHIILVADTSASMSAIYSAGLGAAIGAEQAGQSRHAGQIGQAEQVGQGEQTGQAGQLTTEPGAVEWKSGNNAISVKSVSTYSSVSSSDTAFEEMKRRLAAYVESVGPDGEVTLLKLGKKPEVVRSRETSKKELLDAINALEPEYGPAAYREALSLAAALTRDDPLASIVVFTDEMWSEQAVDMLQNVPVQLVPIGKEQPFNIGIEQFGVKEESGDVSGVAVLRNYSSRAIQTDVRLYGDGQLVSIRPIELAAKSSITIAFDEIPTQDVYKLLVAATDDYELDNTSFAFREKGEAPQVLLVSEGNLFLEKALQLAGARVSLMTPGTSLSGGADSVAANSNSAVPKVGESKPDIIIVDGPIPHYMTSGEWARLLQETPLWTWGSEGKRVELQSGTTQVHSHPVTKYISLLEPPASTLLADEVPGWGKSLIEIDGLTAAYAGTENGVNRLVFLFALADGDLPLRPEFPIIVNNAVQWLYAGKTTGLGRFIAQEELELPVTAEAVQGRWVALDGYARKMGMEPVDAVIEQGRVSSLQVAPNVPGLWRLEMNRQDGSMLPGYHLEAIADPAESVMDEGLKLAFEEEFGTGQGLENTLGSNGTEGQTEEQTVGGSTNAMKAPLEQRSKSSLVAWVTLLALLIIIVEWGVYQRGNSI